MRELSRPAPFSPMKTMLHRHSRRLVMAGLVGLLAGSVVRAAAPLAQAQAAIAQNDFATAETLLAPLVSGEHADAAACHELGTIRMRQKRFDDAVPLLEKATALDGTKAPYFASLGMALAERMGQVSMLHQAMLAMRLKKAFAKAVELDPHNVPGLIGLARFYTQAPEIAGGSAEKAKEFAERVRKIVPHLGELELGNIAEHNEDYATAASHYQAAGQATAADPGPRLAAARVLKKLGRNSEARTHLETALKLAPTNPRIQQALDELE